jgi:nicotinate-nucleotide adenylyltransferase
MFFNPSDSLLSSQWRGMRVGLLGGSFNPPHEGHLHISRIALRMLRLDAIWWLVSPQNPLKKREDYAPLPARLAACEALIAHEPHMLATTIEDSLGTHRSFDTLNALRACFKATDFIFLMGSDSAQSIHKWYRWRDIPEIAPLGILARPPAALQARNCP